MRRAILLSSSFSFVLGLAAVAAGQPAAIPSPAEHFGHEIGADRKLVRWEGIVRYLELVGEASGRVNVRDLGPSTQGRPFLLLEISSEETLADLDRYKSLERRLYFQDHLPGQDPDGVHTAAEREEIFADGKAVVLITCAIHATEVGSAQMSMELVHHLATETSPRVAKILDNVIFLLVPSLNPDGQDMVADWYGRHVGGEHEAGPLPWLYHPYVGHDNNRDMYMYTQVETRRIGEVLYREWFPSIWLDEHQMGSLGPRIFTMPATDPINLNVHPLIYRLNGVYGQAQAAALEKAGKTGIIYDFIYTNFWEGAMAWTGWWHNQVGMLTEVASVRLATPTEQKLAKLGEAPSGPRLGFREARRRMLEHPDEPLPAPRDVEPRTAYPRPWLGGTWTLRDIVDYELIVSLALLETAADTRRQLHEQIYEVNRSTIAQYLWGPSGSNAAEGRENGGYGPLPESLGADRPGTGRVMAGHAGALRTPFAAAVRADQHDPPTVVRMLRLLERGGVRIERATEPFEASGETYPAGTFVIRLAQVFGRYAHDLLEAQTYPEVRPAPALPPEPPYDVTAWSLGMQMGVEVDFVDEPFAASLELLDGVPLPEGGIEGQGGVFLLDAVHDGGFALVNRLWADGDRRIRRSAAAFTASGHRFAPGTWMIEGAPRRAVESLAAELGLTLYAVGRAPAVAAVPVRRPRIAVYQPWGSNMDEGWTRWVVERFGFAYTTLHPQDLRAAGAGSAEAHRIPAEERAGWPPHVAERAPPEVVAAPLAERFDVLVFTHQEAEDIVDGRDYKVIPPVYRGGIGRQGLAAVRDFVEAGGTVVALGDATGLLAEHWPIPVRNAVAHLDEDDFLIPGSVLRIQTDPTHPLAWGLPADSYGYFIRSPALSTTEGFRGQRTSIAVRYPNAGLRASGWTRGEEHVAGRAAAVEIELEGAGRLVLLGLRPQHRAQTHATFKLLFNALTPAAGPEG